MSLQFKGLPTKYASAKCLFHATVFQNCQTFYFPVGLQNHVSATVMIIIIKTKSTYERIENVLARESNACIINVSNRLASSQLIVQLPMK